MSTKSKEIKKILINLAAQDVLPLDMNELDESIFDHLFETPVVDLLDYKRREDMLIGALEGGSNYWYNLPDVSMCDKYRKENSEPLVIRMMRAIAAGESVPVHDIEAMSEEDSLVGHIDMDSIRKGEALMQKEAAQHWGNLISENDDAETADVWFQYCVLGDIVYG